MVGPPSATKGGEMAAFIFGQNPARRIDHPGGRDDAKDLLIQTSGFACDWLSAVMVWSELEKENENVGASKQYPGGFHSGGCPGNLLCLYFHP